MVYKSGYSFVSFALFHVPRCKADRTEMRSRYGLIGMRLKTHLYPARGAAKGMTGRNGSVSSSSAEERVRFNPSVTVPTRPEEGSVASVAIRAAFALEYFMIMLLFLQNLKDTSECDPAVSVFLQFSFSQRRHGRCQSCPKEVTRSAVIQVFSLNFVFGRNACQSRRVFRSGDSSASLCRRE